MDVHLDFGMSKVASLHSIHRKDYEETYWTVMKALGYRDWAPVEGTRWPIPAPGLLRKQVQTCVTKGAVCGALQCIHEVKGHRSPE